MNIEKVLIFVRLLQLFPSTKVLISSVTKGREVYDEYYGYMLRCSAIFYPAHKEIMYDKMIHFLRTKDSDSTVE